MTARLTKISTSVHRDISPQNLLIGYSGNVKIIDFGIAKAASNRQTTRAGIIKGKPSYLSPEQITGEVLDGRSDVFSLGAVLWETLTGRKLFAGESDLAAIRLIEDCDRNVKPPSMVNPEVPEELDNIVFRALTHDRDARYKSAEEMQRALHRAIYNFKPSFDPSDFGTYLHELFKDEIEQEHKDLQMLNKEAKELFANNSFKSLPSLSNDFSAPSLSMQTRTEETTQPSDPHDIPKLPAARPKGMLNAESTGSREIDQDLLGMKNGEITLQNEFDTHAPTRPRDLYKRPKIKNPGDSSAIPKVILTIVVIAAGVFYVRPDILHTMLRYLNHHGQPAKEKTIPKPAEPIANDYGGHPLPVAPPEFSPTPVAPLPVSHEVGMLVIKTIPDGGLTKVVINDGETFSADRPIQVPLKTPLKMTISKPGFQPVVREMTITQEGQTNLDISFEPAKYGVMTIHATPSARLQLLMDGMHWTFNTPMDAVKMPPGNYRVQLANDMLGMGQNHYVSSFSRSKHRSRCDVRCFEIDLFQFLRENFFS